MTETLCGELVFNTDSAGKPVGDICPCVLEIGHNGICLCKHKIHLKHQIYSDPVDAVVRSWAAYSNLKKGQYDTEN